jgi:hypothetical protein
LIDKDNSKFVQIQTEEEILECEVKDAGFSVQIHKSLIYNKHFLKIGIAFLLAIIVAIAAMMLAMKVSTR